MNIRQKSYEDKLGDEKWIQKKRKILRRDDYTCKICLSNNNLNVHHRYYIHGNEPWDYVDDALVTLCECCHHLVHETLAPLVYINSADGFKTMNFTPCKRCGGYGFLSEFKYVQNGICFRCRGKKFEELIEFVDKYEIKKLQRNFLIQ